MMSSKPAFLRQLSKKSVATALALTALTQTGYAQKPSISGISSGGFMSVQMATIFSSRFSGVGTVAGGFFYCAQNHLQDKIEEGQKNILMGSRNLLSFEATSQFYAAGANLFIDTSEKEKWFAPKKENPIYQAVGVCMANPAQATLPDLNKMAAAGKIDSTDTLKNLKAYIYQGSSDTVVNKDMISQLTSFYINNGIADSQIKTTLGTGGHNFPTDKEGLNDCKEQDIPYISSCGMDIAKEILEHTTGKSLVKSTVKREHLYMVDQTLDLKNKAHSEDKWIQPSMSLAPYGYLYAPEQCLNNPASCTVHVALHGCKMSDSFSQEFDEKYQKQVAQTTVLAMRTNADRNFFNFFYPTNEEKINQYGTLKFAVNSGYIDYAEKNNLMILFPQTWITEKNYPYNPKGCWDWFGWTGHNYANKNGAEAKWMMKFIDQITKNPKEAILSTRPHFEALEQK